MVLITQSYNSLKPHKLSHAWKKKKRDAQFSFFNYIIKLQAVLPGSAQKVQQSLNT